MTARSREKKTKRKFVCGFVGRIYVNQFVSFSQHFIFHVKYTTFPFDEQCLTPHVENNLFR